MIVIWIVEWVSIYTPIISMILLHLIGNLVVHPYASSSPNPLESIFLLYSDGISLHISHCKKKKNVFYISCNVYKIKTTISTNWTINGNATSWIICLIEKQTIGLKKCKLQVKNISIGGELIVTSTTLFLSPASHFQNVFIDQTIPKFDF